MSLRTVSVLQPGYIPWLGFFDQMQRVDVFVVYDDVQFDKHGWRNRNRVKSPNGPYWLTVPVRHHGLMQPRINEIVIDRQQPWVRKHVGTFRQFYAAAPFLESYLPALEELLRRDYQFLIDLDVALIEYFASCFGIKRKMVLASQLNIVGERTERLIRICQHYGASHYLSGDAAKAYLDDELFRQSGIDVVWHSYRHPVYRQQYGAFVSHLSAADLLFNCGSKSREFFVESNEKRNFEL